MQTIKDIAPIIGYLVMIIIVLLILVFHFMYRDLKKPEGDSHQDFYRGDKNSNK